jgi:hypothetical protein
VFQPAAFDQVSLPWEAVSRLGAFLQQAAWLPHLVESGQTHKKGKNGRLFSKESCSAGKPVFVQQPVAPRHSMEDHTARRIVPANHWQYHNSGRSLCSFASSSIDVDRNHIGRNDQSHFTLNDPPDLK